MSKQTLLPVILVTTLAVFATARQGVDFFADSVLAAESVLLPGTNLTAPSNTSLQTKKSAANAETPHVAPLTNSTTQKSAGGTSLQSAAVSTPTFTTPSAATHTQSTDAKANTVPAASVPQTSTTNRVTENKAEAPSLSSIPATVSPSTSIKTTEYTAPASGALQVTTKAPDAKSVEYYSQSQQSGAETYLGAGQQTSSGAWSMNLDAANRLPNGEYNVSAKAEQQNGTVVESQPAQLKVATPESQISQTEKTQLVNSEKDTDGDGISDKEEIRLGTNPQSADTDKDGFIDSDEIKNGFDPLKFSSGDMSDKIVFSSPKDAPVAAGSAPEKKVNDRRFKVDKIELVNTAKDGKQATRFSGSALPNMFITLYIYSDPIIVTVKTDADGNWTYDLDKDLSDGDHEVFVAVTDNVGKISAQSEALPFVKTAQAVTINPAAASSAEAVQNASPLERSKTEFFITAIIIATSFLGIALVLIGRKSSVI